LSFQGLIFLTFAPIMNILEKIVSTSEKLFMNYGLKSISMDDIANELGMSKKTIYKHFSTKDRLIHITLSTYLRKEKRIVNDIVLKSENAVEEIVNIGRHVIKMARRLKPTLVFDLKKYHAKNWDLIEEHHFNFIQELIQNNLKRGMNEGYFRTDMDPLVIAKLYVTKSLMISDENSFPMDRYSREDLFKQHLLYHLYGVLSNEGIKLAKNYELETL